MADSVEAFWDFVTGQTGSEAALAAARKLGTLEVRLRGQLVENKWGYRGLISPDDPETRVEFAPENKWSPQALGLKNVELGAMLEVVGVVDALTKDKGTWIKIAPRSFKIEKCVEMESGGQKRNPCEDVETIIKSSGRNSFNTRPFPENARTIGVICSPHPKSPIMSDIASGLSSGGAVETILYNASIHSADAIVKAIKDAAGCDILMIAYGGMEKGGLDDPKVLAALNATPERQFRVGAFNHSTVVPAAYLFCDLKAQSPTDGGNLLGALLEKTAKDRDAKAKAEAAAKAIEKERIEREHEREEAKAELDETKQKLAKTQKIAMESHVAANTRKKEKFHWSSAAIIFLLGVIAGFAIEFLSR